MNGEETSPPTYATRAAANVPLVTLAALLGHSSLAMVLKYAHVTESHTVEAAKKLAAYNASTMIAEYEHAERERAQKRAASSESLQDSLPNDFGDFAIRAK